jgi:hypothetical protein
MHRLSLTSVSKVCVPLAALALPVAMCACHTGAQERRVRADPAGAVPNDIVFYPHVLYGGEAAYLVDDKWYRPDADGWVVFTEEPLELELLRKALEPRRAGLGF